jgi:hypothetical protein
MVKKPVLFIGKPCNDDETVNEALAMWSRRIE